MNKISFFEESPGRQSFTRLSSAYLLLLAGAYILYPMFKSSCDPNIEMTVILLSYALGSKLIQKPFEKKNVESNK